MMDHQHTRDHLQILNNRVVSLEQELKVALKHGKENDEKIKALQDALDTITTNRNGRLEEMEIKFEAEQGECDRQIRLAEDVLSRKKEERLNLMSYLDGLELDENSFWELREFDWVTLEKLASNVHKPHDSLVEQQNKADSLNEAIQKVKQRMSELNELLVSTTFVRGRLTKSIDEVKAQHNHWDNVRELQKKRIDKIQVDNERLYTLIRQCVATNEPMSEFVSRNIKEKCQSFVKSENSQELLQGLMKFKSRQDRIINMLRYKDNKLGSETNKLQVAKDQTHDQVKFYTKLSHPRQGVSMQ